MDRELENPPLTGMAAMKANRGNQFAGALVQFEDLESSYLEEDGETPKRNFVYTFNVTESNFDGMKPGLQYRIYAPTRFDREIRKFCNPESPEIMVGREFVITYDGEQKTSKGGKAACFTVQRVKV